VLFEKMKDNILLKKSFDTSNFSGVEMKKFLQKKIMLKHLYIEKALSTPEISRITNLSAPTVISLLNELIKEQIVIEKGTGNSSGGRKPNLFGLNAEQILFLAIDIRNHYTRITIFDVNNAPVSEIRKVDVRLANKIEVMDLIVEEANKLIEQSGINKECLISVGVSFPGLVDSEKGINYTYFDIKGGIRAYLEAKFDRPVEIENDARIRALGELKFGLAKGLQNVLVIDVDWGIGLGMILNGKLYRGNSGFAGEFSHINIVEEGLLCACGKRGCLETVASAGALTELAKEELRQGKLSLLNEMAGNDINAINSELIIQAAIDGDQFAIGLFDKVGKKLGKGIASLVHLYNPEKIIIGGKLSRVNDYLIAPIYQMLNKFCISKVREDVVIEVSTLNENSGIIGAAAFVMDSIFNAEN